MPTFREWKERRPASDIKQTVEFITLRLVITGWSITCFARRCLAETHSSLRGSA